MARRSVTIVASDGRREGISWYDGATEAAVLRCALLALGLPLKSAAHLLWQSGDIVDLGTPITDGATLHLDTVRELALPSQEAAGDVYTSGGHDHGGSSSSTAQRRVNSSNTAVGGGGGGGEGGVAPTRRGGSVSGTASGGGGDCRQRPSASE
ncbi:hypothetical protein Esi_0031_0028 [Ectocarpus siliculosus]|uniref:Uncharacterized protein n=1 Tax=Ectocarpus siliculosus TaxID=2880 RepID=D8LKT5_ECTSI|nr:hypothetical protein Esi_0031_0028 [Ectocarpus siliculosus]|eukprot:CBN80068.1 hypothetical protein Esi_0031_0028 [Ectocarpus siliculosus]